MTRPVRSTDLPPLGAAAVNPDIIYERIPMERDTAGVIWAAVRSGQAVGKILRRADLRWEVEITQGGWPAYRKIEGTYTNALIALQREFNTCLKHTPPGRPS